MKNQLKCIIFTVFLIFILVANGFEVSAQNLSSNTGKSLEYKNAIVTNIWLEDSGKLDLMRSNEIKYLIVDVGDTGKDGKLLTPEKDILYFLNFVSEYEKSRNYTFILLPYSEINTYDYDVNSKFENNFINDYYNLDVLGFDGIFVDIEPARFEQRDSYLELLSKLREKLGNNKIISVYSGQIGNDSSNEWEWDVNFLKKVSQKADIISIPVYDTSITHKDEYEKFVKDTLDIILTNKWNSCFFLAVPTHKRAPEILDTPLKIYSEEKFKYPENKLLGVDVFSEWTMSSGEWNTFHNYISEENILKDCKKPSSFRGINFISYMKANKICKSKVIILK